MWSSRHISHLENCAPESSFTTPIDNSKAKPAIIQQKNGLANEKRREDMILVGKIHENRAFQ